VEISACACHKTLYSQLYNEVCERQPSFRPIKSGPDMDYPAIETIPPVAAHKPTHRSRVTKGSKLLPLTDGRSTTARRFRDLFENVCNDLGGAAHLSEAQRQLVSRAAMLNSECERLEALSARGEPGFDIDAYGMLCDQLGRVFGRIGLNRVPRDATTLQQYVAKSAKASAAEIDFDAD